MVADLSGTVIVFSRYVLILITTILCTVSAMGQASSSELKGYTPTENINPDIDFNRRKNAPKKKDFFYIIKNDMHGFLYGNPCVLEQTRRMGFEYTVQIEGIPGSLRPWRRRWNNTLGYTRLTITRSPFWKLILNKRIKNCRQKSGDIVG